MVPIVLNFLITEVTVIVTEVSLFIVLFLLLNHLLSLLESLLSSLSPFVLLSTFLVTGSLASIFILLLSLGISLLVSFKRFICKLI